MTIASRIEAGGGGMTRRSLPAKATLEHKMASRIAQRP
jgi:hypothetical protein